MDPAGPGHRPAPPGPAAPQRRTARPSPRAGLAEKAAAAAHAIENDFLNQIFSPLAVSLQLGSVQREEMVAGLDTRRIVSSGGTAAYGMRSRRVAGTNLQKADARRAAGLLSDGALGKVSRLGTPLASWVRSEHAVLSSTQDLATAQFFIDGWQ